MILCNISNLNEIQLLHRIITLSMHLSTKKCPWNGYNKQSSLANLLKLRFSRSNKRLAVRQHILCCISHIQIQREEAVHLLFHAGSIKLQSLSWKPNWRIHLLVRSPLCIEKTRPQMSLLVTNLTKSDWRWRHIQASSIDQEFVYT